MVDDINRMYKDNLAQAREDAKRDRTQLEESQRQAMQNCQEEFRKQLAQ